MTSHAVVTGASTGIGRAAVKVLTERGWGVFAGVRKPSDVDSLRQEFGDKVARCSWTWRMPRPCAPRPRRCALGSPATRSAVWSTMPAWPQGDAGF
jgi:NAD(P)-dependent dehydrogenase (short-subunit alcohol dehydrogenase family)